MAIVIYFVTGGQEAKHNRFMKQSWQLPDPRSRGDGAIRELHFTQPEIDTFVVLQLNFLFWSRVVGRWCHGGNRLEIRGSVRKLQEC